MPVKTILFSHGQWNFNKFLEILLQAKAIIIVLLTPLIINWFLSEKKA